MERYVLVNIPNYKPRFARDVVLLYFSLCFFTGLLTNRPYHRQLPLSRYFYLSEKHLPAIETKHNEETDNQMATNWQPLRVILALLVAVVSAVASVIILVSSNNRPVTGWFDSRARPTVLLAVCTVAANISIHYTLSEGLPVRWWLQAAPNRRASNSFDKLRDIYDQGTGAWSAVSGTFTLKPNRAGIAYLACMAVALNGPFLQRASRVETEVYSTDVDISTNLALVAPFGFSGLKTGRTGIAQALTPSFAEVVKSFTARGDIVLGNETGCVGTCRAEIEGMGFAVNCSDGTYEYNMGAENPDPNSDIIINLQGGIGF